MQNTLMSFYFLEENSHEYNRIWIPTSHYVRKR